MGAAVGSQCFSNADEAAALACSSLAGVVGGGTLQCASVGAVAGGQATASMVSWPVGAAGGSTYSQTIYLPACDAVGVGDGMAIGWGVGGVWLVVSGLLYLRKVLS
jgi:hypothetical protein